MSIPSTSVDVPVRVRELARGAALTPVWLNGIGGLTFRTDDGRYIKWGPLDDEANIAPWLRAANRFGAKVKWAEVDIETGAVELTRLVAVDDAAQL